MALREIPGWKQKNAISQSLGHFWGKSVRPKSFSPKVRNFFTICVLADRTPTGGKSQNTGILGPFGLGQPLAERFRAENGKMQFPGARGTFGEKIPPPQEFLPKIAQLFYMLCFRRPDPHGREIAKYRFSRPFWPRAAPWHLAKFRAGNRKTQFPRARGTFGEKVRPPQKFLPKIGQLFYMLRFG